MPELPEVETIRTQLSSALVGEKIVSFEIRRDKSFRGNPKELSGRTIASVKRIGKYLFFHTDKWVGMVGHLKMTGRMIVKNGEFYQTAKHTRVVVTFESGQRLYFWDTRVFGYLEVTSDSKLAEVALQKRLGADPWQISPQEFHTICMRYKRPIKNLILDQENLSGVGNIYANDGLWKAGIDPRRPASSLSTIETEKLLTALREVLERGLLVGGASDNSYVDAHNEKGSYQDEFLVYRLTGAPCKKCQTSLTRVVVGGRGTWLCSSCQK
jgi:formamidopyrimidine-DNA glycosylase